jgi:hypothetical protein
MAAAENRISATTGLLSPHWQLCGTWWRLPGSGHWRSHGSTINHVAYMIGINPTNIVATVMNFGPSRFAAPSTIVAWRSASADADSRAVCSAGRVRFPEWHVVQRLPSCPPVSLGGLEPDLRTEVHRQGTPPT